MTDEGRGIGGTVGPPWSVDVLADLHAGVLEECEAAELWPLVNADPGALAIIRALEATTADLSGLAAAPVEPMPADVATRLDAAIDNFVIGNGAIDRAVRQPPHEPAVAPPTSLNAARSRRNKRLGWGAGLLAAAAAAVAAVVIIVPGGERAGDNSVAQPPAPASPSVSEPSVGADGSGAEALYSRALGVRVFGQLQDEKHLDACLQANGLDPAVRPDGIRPVTVGGRPGVMVIYTTGKFAQYRLVAFPASCDANHPGKLFDKVVGAK